MFSFCKHGSSSILNCCTSFQEYPAECKMTSLVISFRMFVFIQKHTHVQICPSGKALLKTIWHIFRTSTNTNVGSPALRLLRFFSSIFMVWCKKRSRNCKSITGIHYSKIYKRGKKKKRTNYMPLKHIFLKKQTNTKHVCYLQKRSRETKQWTVWNSIVWNVALTIWGIRPKQMPWIWCLCMFQLWKEQEFCTVSLFSAFWKKLKSTGSTQNWEHSSTEEEWRQEGSHSF